MRSTPESADPFAGSSPSALRVGFYSALATSALAAVSFGLALQAVPISGAFCPVGCIEYPYLGTASQFPRDFVWMIPAMLLAASYMVLTTAIRSCVSGDRSVFARVASSFALIAATTLLIDYFVQFSVVPASLMTGQTQGLPLIIQYNPHGVFLVLEELGYLTMSLSFLFLAPALPADRRVERVARRIFAAGFAAAVLSLVLISARFGLHRLDRFEVAVITVDWLVLLVNGVLLAFVFARRHRRTVATATS